MQHTDYYAVASPHYLATEVGLSILQAGGNAFDAAVATSLAVGVVQPYHSGLGGGCCINVRLAGGEMLCIQARGDAPAALTPERFHDADGNPQHRLAREGGLAVVVPGQVAALRLLHEKFGRLAWRKLCMAPHALAADGFAADSFLARMSQHAMNRPKLGQFGNGMAVAAPRVEGERLMQPQLAQTLATLGDDPDAIYHGEIAAAIAQTVQAAGGVLTMEDLANYRAHEQQPIVIGYRGWQVLVPQTPTIGALQTALALQILDRFALSDYVRGSVEHLHLVAEAVKLSYMARAGLESEQGALAIADAGRAREMAGRIHLEYALPFAQPEGDALDNGSCTSHISVADAEANVVSMTQTVRSWFGSGIVEPTSGIVLNDTAGDFSLREGDVTNQGIRYGKYNLVAPGLAPASSQSPIIAVHPPTGDVIAAGAAGGPTIVSATVQALVNCIDFGLDAQASAAAPRVHCHGPELLVEPTVDVQEALAALGHNVKEQASIAIMQMVRRRDGSWSAGIDPRGVGLRGGTDGSAKLGIS